MSRTISDSLKSAIDKISGIRAINRLTIYKNRNYFSTFDCTSGSPTYAQGPVIVENPISQTSEYDSVNSRLYTLFVNPVNENLEITTSGSGQIGQICTSGSPIYSPAWHKISTKFPYLYHVDKTGKLQVETLNMTTLKNSFSSGTINCISSSETIETLTSGSISALCAIDTLEFIRLFIDDGGIGVVHYKKVTGSWAKNTYSHRFMVPDQVLSTDSTNGYLLQFFTAVKRDDGIWIYLTYPNGEVKGIHINLDGIWSDIFVAIPEDLCTFQIVNSFIDSNQRIHLSCQFQRIDSTGAFASNSIWNLLCFSDDGKIFSIDRNTLYSLMGYRFSAIPVGNDMYFIDANRYKKLTATYSSIYENTDSLVLRKELTSFNGTPDNGYKLSLTTTDDALLDHELIAEGNIAKLEIGINTSGSNLEWTTWDTCIISSISTFVADAKRNLSLDIMSEGVYRLSQFTYPFYLEMQGKQSVFDPMSDMSNMYKAPNSSGVRETFSTDLWGSENLYGGGGLCAQFHNTEGSMTIMSTDLKDYLYLSDYPIVQQLPLTFKIFGWGRIGVQTGADYFVDTTPASNPNDDFCAIIKVKHADDTEETITMTKDQATGEISYFPQTWKEGNSRLTSGSYPVQYLIDVEDGLVIGDKVLEVGVLVSSTSACVFYPERIEIPELSMYIDPDAQPQDSEVVQDLTNYDPIIATTSWDFDDGTTQGWSVGLPADEHTICITGAVGASNVNSFYAYNGGIGFSAGGNWSHGNAYYDISSQNIILRAGVTFTGTYYGIHSHAGFKVNAAIECTDGSMWRATGDIFSSDIGWLNDGDTGTFTVTPPEDYYGKVVKRVWVGTFGYQYDNPQNKIFDNLSVNGVEASGENEFNPVLGKKGIVIKNLGIPNVYFSSNPYSAFNFECSVKVKITGSYSYGGIVGIAEDGQNFICGRYKLGTLEIVKVRDGTVTVLATTSYTTSNTFVRLMFTHKDGDLSIRIQEGSTWGIPKLTYRWKYADGPMATDIDLFHVGIYSISDVPKFRICSFDSSQSSFVPLLAGYDLTKFEAFPSSGTIVIDNIIYTYTGKTATSILPKGPFQVRCENSWNYSSPYDGENYSGNSIEFTMFNWGNHESFNGYLAHSNAGYGWMIDKIDYTVWITTDGQLIYLKDRARVFCTGLSVDTPISCSDKIFITVGLTGVALAPDQEIYSHQEGTYCYQQQDSEIEFTDFYGSSDDQDSTISDLINKICKMCGTKPLFTGDNVYSSLSLTDGVEEDL